MIFVPKPAAGTLVSTTTTHSNTDLASHQGSTMVRVSNASLTAAEFVYVRVGTGTQEATTTDMVVLAGESVILPLPSIDPNIALEAASGTPSVMVQPGDLYQAD